MYEEKEYMMLIHCDKCKKTETFNVERIQSLYCLCGTKARETKQIWSWEVE